MVNQLIEYLNNVFNCLGIDPEAFTALEVIKAHPSDVQEQLTTILDRGQTVTVAQVSQQRVLFDPYSIVV